MIRYVRHHFIDRKKYDDCLRLDERGLPYGYSWFLDAVCDSWDALVLDDYTAVWPLPVRRRWGIRYSYRPFGVQQLGIFTKKPLSQDQIKAFVTEMQKHFRYSDLYLNEGQTLALDDFPAIQASLVTNLTLSLAPTYRELYQSFRKSTQRQVRKAANADLQLFERDDPGRVMALFRQNKGEQLRLPEEFYRNVEKAIYRSLHFGVGKVWTVYAPPNNLVAGAFFLANDKRHVFFFSGQSDEGRAHGAMYYLLNEYLIYHSEKPQVFDFEGSKNAGLAHFYKGFGAQLQPYQRLHYNGLPLPLRWLKR